MDGQPLNNVAQAVEKGSSNNGQSKSLRRSQIIRRTGGLLPGFVNPENFVISDSNSSHDDSGFSPDSPVHGGERITSKFPLSTAKYSNSQTTQPAQPVSGVPPKRTIQHIPSKQTQFAVYEGLATVTSERPVLLAVSAREFAMITDWRKRSTYKSRAMLPHTEEIVLPSIEGNSPPSLDHELVSDSTSYDVRYRGLGRPQFPGMWRQDDTLQGRSDADHNYDMRNGDDFIQGTSRNMAYALGSAEGFRRPRTEGPTQPGGTLHTSSTRHHNRDLPLREDLHRRYRDRSDRRYHRLYYGSPRSNEFNLHGGEYQQDHYDAPPRLHYGQDPYGAHQ